MPKTIVIKILNNRYHLNTQIACVLFLVLWITNGFLAGVYYYIPVYIKVLPFFIWLMSAYKKRKYFLRSIIQQEYLLFMFLINLFVTKLVSTVDVDYYIKATLFLIIFYTFFLYYKDENNDVIRSIVVPIAIDYIIIGINTFIKLNKYPNIARALSHSDEEFIYLYGLKASFGIGNYTYAYSIALIAIFLAYCITKKKNVILSLILYFCCFALLIKSGFAISIILVLFECILVLFFQFKQKKYSILSGLLLFIVIFLLVVSNISKIILLFPEEIGNKLSSVASIFTNKGNFEILELISTRPQLYMRSIQTIINSPILGSLINGTISDHSTWLDIYASIGILSIPIYLFIFLSAKQISKVDKVVGKLELIFWIVLGLINTAHAPRLILTMFFIVPLFTILISNKSEKKEI